MEGKKYDDLKINYSLIPHKTIEAVAAVFTYGSLKYAPWNWTKIDSVRLLSAVFRHLMENSKEPLSKDEETGFYHLDHAITSLMMYREKLIIEKNAENLNYIKKCKELKEKFV